MSDLVRLSVNMNLETAAALRTISTANSVSYTEAVRRVVALASYLYEERDAGRRVLSDDGQGNDVRELVLL